MSNNTRLFNRLKLSIMLLSEKMIFLSAAIAAGTLSQYCASVYQMQIERYNTAIADRDGYHAARAAAQISVIYAIAAAPVNR